MAEIVSVIVPVYNTGENLAQCLSSIRGQSYQTLEIILVDDGSTDGSGEACDAAAGEDSRIRVIHKKNGGLVSAWKAGVHKATGAYLMFVDSDDWIDPDFIETLAKETTGAEDEIISAGFVIERGNGRSGEKVSSRALPGLYEGEKLKNLKTELIGHESRSVILSRCMKLTSRKLFLANMGYAREDIRMGEDVTVMLPCLLACRRLVLLGGVCGYHYRTVATSMAHGYDAGLYDNVKRLRAILDRIAEDFGIPDGKQKVEREFYYLMLLELKNQLRRGGKDAGERRGIRETIQREIVDEHLKPIQEKNPEKPKDRANRLLAMMIQSPNKAAIVAMERVFQTK